MNICRMLLMKLLPILLMVIWSFCPVLARPLQDIMYSPDGSKFLVRELSAAYLRDSATGKILKVFEYRRADGSTYNSIGFAVFLSNKTLILNDEKRNLIWWSIKDSSETKRSSRRYAIVEISADRKLIAGLDIDSRSGNVINIYRSDNGRLLKTVAPRVPDVGCLAFLSDNERLVVGSSQKAVIFSPRTGKISKSFPYDKSSRDCVVSPTGQSVLMSSFFAGPSGQKSFPLVNLNAGRQHLQMEKKYSELVSYSNAVGYSGADHDLAFVAGRSTVSRKGILIVWNLSTGKIKQVVYNDIEIETAAFSPDGRTILFLDRHRGLILIDLASGVRLRNYNETPQKELVGFFRYTSDDQKCC